MDSFKTNLCMFFFVLIFCVTNADEQCSSPARGSRIREVVFKDGQAGATSSWGDFGFYGSGPNWWHLGPEGGPPSPMPVMIWYDLKSKTIRPAEVSFQPGKPNNIQRGPTVYEFVGSNDPVCSVSGSWVVLCKDYSNVPWKSAFDTKYCYVEPEMKAKFRCIGLRVLGNLSNDGWVVIKNIRVFERIEKKCVCVDD